MARIGGCRGRLVGDAVVFLFFTLNSCRNSEPGEPTEAGGESGHGRWVVESQSWLVIDGNAGERRRWWVDPSTKRRCVTGLKGSPLRIVVKQLIGGGGCLAEQRLQKRRRLRRRWLRTEHKSGGNSVSGATPRHHSLKPTWRVVGPTRPIKVFSLLLLVVVVLEDWILK